MTAEAPPPDSTLKAGAVWSVESPTASRRSSTSNGFIAACELETAGSAVGLVEPIDSTSLGLFPAWVYATKKTWTLAISQRDIADALDGFRADIEPLRRSLIEQHTTLVDSLKIPLSLDSPLAMCEAAAARRRDSFLRVDQGLGVVTERDRERVAAVELSVHESMQQVAAMKENLSVLPRILELIEDANRRGELDTLARQG